MCHVIVPRVVILVGKFRRPRRYALVPLPSKKAERSEAFGGGLIEESDPEVELYNFVIASVQLVDTWRELVPRTDLPVDFEIRDERWKTGNGTNGAKTYIGSKLAANDLNYLTLPPP